MVKKMTLDNLGVMIKHGFDGVDKRFDAVDKRFEGVDKRFDHVEKNLNILSENNAREHEEIKLRLDNVAYRFELVELQKRVEKLEKAVLSKK